MKSKIYKLNGVTCNNCVQTISDLVKENYPEAKIQKDPAEIIFENNEAVTISELNEILKDTKYSVAETSSSSFLVNLKKFSPLIIITLLTIIFAYLHTIFLDNSAMTFMQYFMAGYFLIFGGLKVINWRNFIAIYRGYDDVAKRSPIYARIYPALEFGIGILYYFSIAMVYVNIFVTVLMFQKSYSVFKKLKAKETVICACLGGYFSLPVTRVTFFEDIFMALMALSMLVHM